MALLVARELRPGKLLFAKLLAGDLRSTELLAGKGSLFSESIFARVLVGKLPAIELLVAKFLLAELLRVTFSVAVLCIPSSRLGFCERRMQVLRLARARSG